MGEIIQGSTKFLDKFRFVSYREMISRLTLTSKCDRPWIDKKKQVKTTFRFSGIQFNWAPTASLQSQLHDTRGTL